MIIIKKSLELHSKLNSVCFAAYSFLFPAIDPVIIINALKNLYPSSIYS
jgi:hypothetical protein